MKVFQIHIVLLLAVTIVFSTPIVEDGYENANDLLPESEIDIKSVDIEPVEKVGDKIDVEETNPSKLYESEIPNGDDEKKELINENYGIPYQEIEIKKPEMSDEMKERIYGIEVDLCKNFDNPKSPLHLSHPTNCGKFYKCGNGRAYLQDCSLYTHFSVNLNRCDYASIARCKPDGNYHFKLKRAKPVQASVIIEETKPEEKPETGDFEIDTRCDGSVDPFKPLHFKHPHDCSKFYKCYMGRAYVVKCPRGQHWAQSLNRCEHTSIAKCNVLKASIKPAQLFVEEADDDDEEIDYEYGDFTYYDISNIMLEVDYKVEDSRCIEIPKDRFHPVQFPHPSDCSTFYKCNEGFGYKVRCPSDLYYNRKTEECDYQINVQCKTVKPAQADVVQANAEDLKIPLCDRGGEKYFPVDDSFTSYFECEDGIPYLHQCDDHELFNPILKKCEHVTISDEDLMQQILLVSSLHENPSKMLSAPIEYIPMQAPYVPNYSQSQFHYQNSNPNMINSNYYPSYMSQNWNNAFPFNDNMQYFGPEFRFQNNWPNSELNFPFQFIDPLQSASVISNDETDEESIVKEFNIDVGKVNQNCPTSDDPGKPVHLAHESDCTKFYKCFYERAFLFECPQNQEWSQDLQRCDYHENANCKLNSN